MRQRLIIAEMGAKLQIPDYWFYSSGACRLCTMLFLWMHLVVFGLVILLALRMIARAAWLPCPAADPICPKCSYCITGLTVARCPECGVDMAEIGIIPRGSRAEPFLFPLIGYSIFAIFCSWPRNRIRDAALRFFPSYHTAKVDGLIRPEIGRIGLRLHAAGDCYSYAKHPAITAKKLRAELEISSIGGPTYQTAIELYLPNTGFHYITPLGKSVDSSDPLTEKDVAQWFRDTGAPMGATSTNKAIPEAFDVLSRIAHSSDLNEFNEFNTPSPPNLVAVEESDYRQIECDTSSKPIDFNCGEFGSSS